MFTQTSGSCERMAVPFICSVLFPFPMPPLLPSSPWPFSPDSPPAWSMDMG